MKTFDKWLGIVTVTILGTIIAGSIAWQFLNLVMGNIHVGGIGGDRGDILRYETQ